MEERLSYDPTRTTTIPTPQVPTRRYPLRMRDNEGEWHNVRHRISYFASTKSESVPMALCLYNVVPDVITESRIVSYVDGR